jgi:uncharacterized membrane protein
MTGIAPIADLDCEGAILGTALVAPESIAAIAESIRIEHFYSVPNQLIWRAILSLHVQGQSCSALSVRAWLQQHHANEAGASTQYIAQLTLHATHPDKLQAPIEVLTSLAKKRRYSAIGQRLVELAASPDADIDAIALDSAKLLANDNNNANAKRLWPQSIPVADYYSVLPEVPWVCRDLCLCQGRPTMLAGYGYSGKTIATLSLAVQVAARKNAFGQFPTRREGRVYHLDHEQGTRATMRRIQRLLRGADIKEHDLDEDALHVKVLPSANLTTQGFEEFLKRELQGASLCSFDSLRAITPGIDENDSKIREYLDILTRVSEATGCAFIVIHHDGKGGKEKESRETMRGSSAIFDACGTVLSFSAAEGEPIKVSAKKTAAEAEGAPFEPFFLQLEDVANGTEPNWGLRVKYKSLQQIHPPESPEDIAIEKERKEEVHVLAYIERHPGSNQTEIVGGVGLARKKVLSALARLERSERVSRECGASKNGVTYCVNSNGDL